MQQYDTGQFNSFITNRRTTIPLMYVSDQLYIH